MGFVAAGERGSPERRSPPRGNRPSLRRMQCFGQAASDPKPRHTVDGSTLSYLPDFCDPYCTSIAARLANGLVHACVRRPQKGQGAEPKTNQFSHLLPVDCVRPQIGTQLPARTPLLRCLAGKWQHWNPARESLSTVEASRETGGGGAGTLETTHQGPHWFIGWLVGWFVCACVKTLFFHGFAGR